MAKKFVNGEWVEYGQEVTLTGSNVELADVLSLSVTAGSIVTAKEILDTTNFEKVYAVATAGTSHSYDLIIYNKYKSIGSAMNYYRGGTTTTGSVNAISPHVEVKSPLIDVRIYNKDTVSRSYDVYVGGIR